MANNFGKEVSPEKSETIGLLGQDRVGCKIVVNNKCLQKSKFLNASEIFYENEKDVHKN